MRFLFYLMAICLREILSLFDGICLREVFLYFDGDMFKGDSFFILMEMRLS